MPVGECDGSFLVFGEIRYDHLVPESCRMSDASSNPRAHPRRMAWAGQHRCARPEDASLSSVSVSVPVNICSFVDSLCSHSMSIALHKRSRVRSNEHMNIFVCFKIIHTYLERIQEQISDSATSDMNILPSNICESNAAGDSITSPDSSLADNMLFACSRETKEP